MKRTTRRTTAITTLAAFSALCLAPRGAAADDAPGDVPRPAAPRPQPAYPPPPAYPQQPAYPPQQQPAYPPQQPAYPAYPPGYGQYPAYPSAAPALPPPRMVLVERPRIGLVIAGAVMFGGIWLTTSMVGFGSENNGAIIPVIGPLLYLRGDRSSFNRDSDRLANVGLVMVTLGQAAGLAMFIGGLVSKEKKWVREAELSVVPTLLQNGGGLAAVGRF